MTQALTIVLPLVGEVLRRCAELAVGAVVVAGVALAAYFPGDQYVLALSLASGFGIDDLQARVDQLEDKAINGEPFAAEDTAFLKDLYVCLAKGARLTIVLRQSGELMDHYLSRTGKPLRVEPRIFLGSARVREQIAYLRGRIALDMRLRGGAAEQYTGPTVYLADPEFFESLAGIAFGRIIARPRVQENGGVHLAWRAEVPWQMLSYEDLYKQYGEYHAWCFPLPNARSLLWGPEYCLWIDDGLGEYLTRIGLAKPFLAYAEWQEEAHPASQPATQASQPIDRDGSGGARPAGSGG